MIRRDAQPARTAGRWLEEQRPVASAPRRRQRFGGTDGNERLTSAMALVLTALLVAEGLTIIRMSGLVSTHMFIGIALMPPMLLKLGSTGYRFARYYTGSRAYRSMGPPRLLLRVLAPVLVAVTIAVFTTGVLLLASGHKSGTLLEAHKVSFIIWGVVFGVHFLAYAPRMVRSVRAEWLASRRDLVPGARLRGLVTAAAAGSGAALAIVLLPTINAWQA